MEVKKNNMKKNRRLTEKRFSGNTILLSTFLGGIVGAVVASLTPKTGSILREKLLNSVDFLQSHTIGQKFSALVQRTNEMMAKSMDYSVRLVDDSKKLITDAYKAGKEAFYRADSENQEKEPFEGE